MTALEIELQADARRLRAGGTRSRLRRVDLAPAYGVDNWRASACS